jgi:hypothetical protein
LANNDDVKGNKKEGIIIFLIVLAGLYFRKPDTFTNPQLWAEDGPIFLHQFYEFGIKSLITPYNGYLHTVPRLIAYVFGILHINLLYIPFLYDFTALLITLFVAFEIWRSSFHLNISHRALYVAAFLLIPIGSEVYLNITNIIWITSLYMVNFLFVGYKHIKSPLSILALFLFALTGPFALLLSPIVVMIAFFERKSLSFQKMLPLALILAGGAVQLYFIKQAGHVSRSLDAPPEHLHLLKMATNNVRDLILLTSGLLPQVTGKKETILCTIIFLGFLYVLFSGYFKVTADRKYVLLMAAGLYFASFIIAYWPTESLVTSFVGPRYYFVPYTCLAWIIIISFDSRIKKIHVCIYLAFFLLQSRFEIMKITDKKWKEEVADYYQGKKEELNINPDGWHVVLPKVK